MKNLISTLALLSTSILPLSLQADNAFNCPENSGRHIEFVSDVITSVRKPILVTAAPGDTNRLSYLFENDLADKGNDILRIERRIGEHPAWKFTFKDGSDIVYSDIHSHDLSGSYDIGAYNENSRLVLILARKSTREKNAVRLIERIEDGWKISSCEPLISSDEFRHTSRNTTAQGAQIQLGLPFETRRVLEYGEDPATGTRARGQHSDGMMGD